MERSLAALAVLALVAAPVCSADDANAGVTPKTDAAPPVVVLVLNHTYKGDKKRVLADFGIPRYSGPFGFGPLEESVRQALGRTDLYGPLLAPTVCPGAHIEDACPAVRTIDDVKLPEAIAALKPSRIVLVRPRAAYYKKAQAFHAGFDVHVLAEDGHRMNTFSIRYVDWHCDVACVQTSYAAAARELAAMFRYMLEVDIGYRTNAVPAAWREKTLLKDFAQWSNDCVEDTGSERIVRQYGLRLWLNPLQTPNELALVSLSWRGCNIFDVR
jgi:hypothetical protein